MIWSRLINCEPMRPLKCGYTSQFACFAALSAAVALISCGGSGGATGLGPAPVTLQSITVTAPNLSVAAGLKEQFTATGNYSDGTTKLLATTNWSTSDPTLATITSTGLLTTFKAGMVTVSAVSGSVTGNAPFHIDPPTPTGLVISPASSSVLIGSGQPSKLSAILSFTDQSTRDISGQVTWGSVNPFTASIDVVGNVTTIHTGYTLITATNGSFSAAADFTVVAMPRFLYVPTDAGHLMSRTTVDASTRQLRMAGYMPTSARNNEAAPCPTTDPSGQFPYVASFLTMMSPTRESQVYGIDH